MLCEILHNEQNIKMVQQLLMVKKKNEYIEDEYVELQHDFINEHYIIKT